MILTKNGVWAATALILNLAATTGPAAAATPVHNIVLVHGAWVNGSGWKPVYDILVKDGYHVTVAEHPMTSFADDVAAVKRILALQDGPTILVAHSYGGAIITDTGNDPHVVGLVYIAAHALDQGETEVANGKRFPNATKAVEKTADGFTYLDPAHYPADFAADLPLAQAQFEAQAQEFTAASVFTVPAGTWWRPRTVSSIRISSACMQSGPTAIRSQCRVQATRCISRIPRKLQR
jgi:pimeloyl-ACP methyl ester carboxylesterase